MGWGQMVEVGSNSKDLVEIEVFSFGFASKKTMQIAVGPTRALTSTATLNT